MKHIYCYFLLLIFLSGCSSDSTVIKQKKMASDSVEASTIGLNHTTNSFVHNLDTSASIVMELIKKGNIAELITPDAHNSADMVDTLIKNFSPAEIAFEIEVLNQKDPIVVLFYDDLDVRKTEISDAFEDQAFRYKEKAKFVKVDVVKLFKIAEQTVITTAPTLMLILNKVEIARSENPDLALFDTEIGLLFNKLENKG